LPQGAGYLSYATGWNYRLVNDN